MPFYSAAQFGNAQYPLSRVGPRANLRRPYGRLPIPLIQLGLVPLRPGQLTPARLPWRAAALLLTLGAGANADFLDAQVPVALVSGRIVDSRSRQPLPQARVTITGMADTLTTDADGRFRADSLGVGQVTLEVRAIGYDIASWSLSLSAGRLELVIEMEGRVPVLDTLEVSAPPDRFDDPNNWRSPSAFRRRMERGVGQFLSPELLRRTQARTLGEVLRNVPGVWVACAGHRCEIRMMGATRPCAPAIFLDGNAATNATGPDFPLQRIMGIEVYRASDAPMELRATNERCGVVAIWTRMDREPGR